MESQSASSDSKPPRSVTSPCEAMRLSASAISPADVALLFDDPVAHEAPRLAELGDLGTATALETVDCTDRWVIVTAQSERSPSAVAPEDRVRIKIRDDGPGGRVTAEY